MLLLLTPCIHKTLRNQAHDGLEASFLLASFHSSERVYIHFQGERYQQTSQPVSPGNYDGKGGMYPAQQMLLE